MTNTSKRLAKKHTLTKEEKPKKINYNSKKYILTGLQALLGALIGVCFFVYHASSQIIYIDTHEETEAAPSFYEISKDYFESFVYTENLNSSVSSILRYVAISEQLEDKGSYNENKLIDVGKYANRHNSAEYDGPTVKYYLDDLIKWGQKAAGEGYSFTTYEMLNAKDYCDFFGIDYISYSMSDAFVDDEAIVASFECLKNLYLTADNKKLEECVDNPEDYIELVSCVKSAASDLYSNYVEYLEFNEQFSEKNTNLRFAVSLSTDGIRTVYTNDSHIYRGISETKLDEIFKGYGEYIYCCPGTLSYNTNTPVLYDTIKTLALDVYSSSFSDDTKIWISLDTSFPVEDAYSLNKKAVENTKKIIPFIVSFGAAAMIGFIAIFVYAINSERKRKNTDINNEHISSFDRLPIEITTLLFILLIIILYLVESYLIRGLDTGIFESAYKAGIPVAVIIFIDIFVALLFLYSFIRRIIYRNIFEGSIYSLIFPRLSFITSGIKKWADRIYDNAGVAIRTWVTYILFLLFNVFWAMVLFFGNKPILAFVILFIFDAATGVAIFNRNYERKRVIDGIRQITDGDYDYKLDNIKMHGDNRELAAAVNDIGLGLSKAVEISTKDEKLKADLITNVSHDIKTPLTSIINYVDLLKRVDIKDENAKKYIKILDEKTDRLKQLTFDLVEASKISSGNISIDLIKIDFVEFIKQVIGEFEDKFEEKSLELVVNTPKNPVLIMADPRHMFRVVENLLNNVCKYALTNTRVYLDLVVNKEDDKEEMVLAIKNISNQQLNIPAEELTERFIRGDVSRNTEGSGLGLSIAKNLTKAQNGVFEIYLDGDLFKVTLTFELVK